MVMPGRQYSAETVYRYGFNGKELDPEGMGGGLTTYDYGFRIYNPAIAKFLSVDPLTASYPWYTPYQFAGNKPIWCIDIDGLEEGIATQMMVNNWERQDHLYESGKISKTEYFDSRKRSQMAVGLGGIAGVVVKEINKSGLSGWYLTLLGIWAQKSVDNYVEISGNEHLNGAVVPITPVPSSCRTASSLKVLSTDDITTKRFKREMYAKTYYEKAGGNPNHTNGIDFDEKVFEIEYAKGTVLEQWSYLDENGLPIQGSYYCLPNADPTKLGIPLENRVKTTVILQEDTKFLQSTAATVEDWTVQGRILDGGETQLYQENVQVTQTINN